MHFLRRRLDIAERQAGEADHALRIVLAEVDDEVVVDAQHLGRRLGVAELRRGGEHAVDDLGVDPVAVEFLGAQVGIARAADALQTVLVKPGLGHAVGAMLLARLIEAAGRADAADQPNEAPLFATHSLPFGPSADERHPVLEIAAAPAR